MTASPQLRPVVVFPVRERFWRDAADRRVAEWLASSTARSI
jgi:hypothetical protein